MDIGTVLLLLGFIFAVVNLKNIFVSLSGWGFSLWFLFTQIDHTGAQAYILTFSYMCLMFFFFSHVAKEARQMRT